jgi:proteasome lid subunit RPN8/RPN11
MKVSISARDLSAIRRHAERGYPHEVCGFLLGERDPTVRRFAVSALRQSDNLRADEARTRYLIDADSYRSVDREAMSRNLDIIGFYHSHPDAPARPSEFDRDQAWPSVAYLIVAVSSSGAGEATGWLLASDRSRFVPLGLEIADPISEPIAGGT